MEMNEISNVKDFAQHLKEHLLDNYPDLAETTVVDVTEVTKNNGTVLQGLTIRDENVNIAPTIYVNDAYENFLKGESMDDIVAGIVNTYESHKAPQNISVEFFTDFDQVKDRLAMKVINGDKNAEMLEGCPHFKFGDLAAIFQVQVESNEFGNATITVKNEHMEMWGVDAQTLMDLARENMEEKQPVRIQSMLEVLQGMMGGEFPEDMMGMPEPAMYVMTNETKINGAAAMIFTDKLQEFAEQHDTNFFILPSSIHEILLVPENGDMDVKGLTDMVREVNDTQVSPEEVLSYNVYFYDKDEKQLMLAETKEPMELKDPSKDKKAPEKKAPEKSEAKSIKDKLNEGKAKVAAKESEPKAPKTKTKDQELS